HDNHTLYDKLKIANPEASEKEIRDMHLLSNFVVLTSQGVPFLHAGVEFLRTKNGVENSYKSPDSINQIDWDQKTKNLDHVKKYKELISLRKAHSSFSLENADEVRKRLSFLDTDERLLAYQIESPANDEWKKVIVVINASDELVDFTIPEGEWGLEFPSSDVGFDFALGKLEPRQGYILAEKR
ncbi:MAG: alpha-1,6-glucosidase domain-containing protein, partial [Bacteroidota bacterium]